MPEYGVDIALRRADSLDRDCLYAVGAATTPTVLELGAGAGGQSRRLVEAGAIVTALDVIDYQTEFSRISSEGNFSSQQLRFIQGNVMELQSLLPDETFMFGLFQRTLHYLPYSAAKQLLVVLRAKVTTALFISVTGVDSDIGRHYAAHDQPLHERFAKLSESAQTTFSINQPVCLYTQSEFKELLVEAGFSITSMSTSAFGNHKAVCQ